MFVNKALRIKFKKTFKSVTVISCNCSSSIEKKGLKDLPGPGPVLPYSGTQWIFSWFGKYSKLKRTLDAREDFLKKYGPIYCEYYGKIPLVSVCDPKDIMLVMKAQGQAPIRPTNDSYVTVRKQKPDVYKTVGLTESNGEEWFNLRRQVAPILLQRPSPGLVDAISPVADKFVAKMKSQENSEDISRDLNGFFAQMSWLMFFGDNFAPDRGEEVHSISQMGKDVLFGIGKLSTSSHWKRFPSRTFKRMQIAEHRLRQIVSKRIEDSLHKQKPKEKLSFETISDQLLRKTNLDIGDVITLQTDFVVPSTLSVGSLFLTVLLHRLSKEPRVVKKIQEELDEYLPRDDSKVENLSLPYLKAVFREAYRLTTIIPGHSRLLPVDIELRGYNIPAFTPIICQTRASARSERYFSSPLQFIPERWLNKAQIPNIREEDILLINQALKGRVLVSPFGVGPRLCAGKVLIELQMKVLLAKILKNFSLESSGELVLGDYFLLAPTHPVPIKFIQRV